MATVQPVLIYGMGANVIESCRVTYDEKLKLPHPLLAVEN